MHLLRDALPEARGRAALRAAAVCLGSPFRGDDAVGPRVAERLREARATILDCADEPTRLLELWDGLDTLVVVDAVSTGVAAGTLVKVDAGSAPLPREIRLASTHALSVGEALELGDGDALRRERTNPSRRHQAGGVVASPSGADADHLDAPGFRSGGHTRSTSSFRKCVAQEMQGS